MVDISLLDKKKKDSYVGVGLVASIPFQITIEPRNLLDGNQDWKSRWSDDIRDISHKWIRKATDKEE